MEMGRYGMHIKFNAHSSPHAKDAFCMKRDIPPQATAVL